MQQELRFENVFHLEAYRDGVLLHEFDFHNDVMTEGKNKVLDTAFGGVTQIGTWYLGLINNTPTPTIAAADTLASHAGWTEATAYSGNRKEWTDASASGGLKSYTALSEFTINATITLYGCFLASAASGTTGTLFSAGAFPTTPSYINGDVIKIGYGVRLN
jgi:hypothetical protein